MRILNAYIKIGLWAFALFSPRHLSQYAEFPSQCNNAMANAELDLLAELQSDPYYVNYVYPEGVPVDTSKYVYSYPSSSDYVIKLIIDPCRNLSYNCCVNVFGTPEYLALKKSGLEPERVVRKTVIADETEILANGNLVYDDGTFVIDTTTGTNPSRVPDDSVYIAAECTALGVPYQYCAGFQEGNVRSPYHPPCTDHNQSLNTLQSCYDINGKSQPHCVAIGFTQTAFISQCNSNYPDLERCGTYLEIHLPYGSPYVNSETSLAEVQLTVNNVSGYSTTTIPLTWLNSTNSVLCAYSETSVRVGSIVYIKPTAPRCCCPPALISSRIGEGDILANVNRLL